jgi:hypothetical protein
MLKKVGDPSQNVLHCILIVLQLKKGADAARGDDTSTLKDLVATWVNQDFSPSRLIRSDDKHSRGFVNDICGKLLCPSEMDWDDNR